MYENMKAHLQEMLDISTTWKSYTPLTSTVVLLQKKDGSLRFCIDLSELNNQTVKDAYLLLNIDETLNSLQWSQWFSLLDLKSEYWQFKMDEESEPLTTYTVGTLEFYGCERMLFRLTLPPFSG